MGPIVSHAVADNRDQEAPLIALGALAATLAVVAGPQWSPPIEISSAQRAVGPELAMNASGDALVVWDQEVGTDCPTSPASLSCVHIVTAAERPSRDGSWTAPIELNRPGVGSRPHVGIDRNGDAAVIWVHDIGVDRVVQATYRRGAAGRWPEPNDLSDYVLAVTNHEVALDAAGNAYVTWAERTSAGLAARYDFRSEQFGVWTGPRTLSTDVTSGPALAVNSVVGPLTPAIAWEEPGRVVVTSNPPFSDALPLVTDTTPAGDAAIAVATEIAVVFPAAGSTGSIVEGALCCDFPFDAKVIGAAREPGAARPQVATSGSTTVAVWLAPDGVKAADASIVGAWSPPATLTRDSGASDPHVALDAAGNAAAVWLSGAGAVQAAIRPGATHDWQPAVTLSSGGASSPRVAIDAAGNAVAVWNRTSGDEIAVESSQLSATGPVIEQVSAPKRAQVRRRVVFTARIAPWASPLAGPLTWRFGDGKSTTGERVTHAYRRPGRYAVTATQGDEAGGVATAMATITVVRRARRS